MLIKVVKVISCSSEHPSYPATNLLNNPMKAGWRCSKPTDVIATVVLKLSEPSTITGLEIGNYRSCIIIVEASTSEEPDAWTPVVNHEFMTHDEALNNKFKDQVQIFTKKDLNPENLRLKFDRVKVTCMQSANPREVFGLEFITLRTEVTVDLGLDAFGRFKLKEKDDSPDLFKEKYLKLFGSKKNYKEELKEKITTKGLNDFSKKQDEEREPKKRTLLQKLENDAAKAGSSSYFFGDISKENQKASDPSVSRTPFGDIIPSPKQQQKTTDNKESKKQPKVNKVSKAADNNGPIVDTISSPKPQKKTPDNKETNKQSKVNVSKPADNNRPNISVSSQGCSVCNSNPNQLCKNCNLLKKSDDDAPRAKKPKVMKKKEFSKLFEGVIFALSGYVNPQRDDIRRKALKMGAKYIADPNTTDNKCTHLICAFKNTPKSQQLKGYCKIISHAFIEDCFEQKKRIPWRRYALDKSDKNQAESEEEIEGSTSPINIYDQDTDNSDADY